MKPYSLFQCTFLTKCIQIRNISPFLISHENPFRRADFHASFPPGEAMGAAAPEEPTKINDHFQQAHFQSHIPMKRGFYVQNTCHTDKGYDPGQSPGSDSGKRSSRRSPGHNWKNAGRDYAAGAFFVEGKGIRIISELAPWGARCFFWRWYGLRDGSLPQPAGSAWSGWVRSAHRPTR